jgi:putative transposase
MTPPASTERYKNHRFPAEIISYGVWLYYRFTLSYRDVQELLFERGIDVTYEAIRQWCLKFGQDYANRLRHRRPRPGDKWHLNEVFSTINGERHYLWRAIDQDGHVLDSLVQRRQNKKAAKKFFRKLLKGLRYVPRVMITDQLKSYGAAKRELLPGRVGPKLRAQSGRPNEWVELERGTRLPDERLSLNNLTKPRAAEPGISRSPIRTGSPHASARLTRSGVNGSPRKRLPVAWAMALAIAAPVGPCAPSPTPRKRSSGRLRSTTSTCGTSSKRRIG